MKKTTIGGQALIEGLLMIGPENAAIAIRTPEGEIVVEKRPLPAKSKISKVPVVRGSVNLFRQMVLGVKALMYSADFVDLEEEDKDKGAVQRDENIEIHKDEIIDEIIDEIKDEIIDETKDEVKVVNKDKNIDNDKNGDKNKKNNDKYKDAIIYLTVIFSLFLSIGLFILLPNLIASFLRFNKDTTGGVILYNIFEGIIRIGLFLGYIILASKMKDIKRIWEYHGAEHKTIHCYENEDELTIENVRKYSTMHPRCGTSFMFLVMVISVIVFSFIGWHGIWINILSRLLLIPLVAGLSYELLRFAGRSEMKLMKIVNTPGMLFQKFTTSEPDDKQIEVAIAAFNGVRIEDKDADKW